MSKTKKAKIVGWYQIRSDVMVKVEIIRQSKVTGAYTGKLLEPFGVGEIGTEVSFMPYEFSTY